MPDFYPLRLRPILRRYIWGGRRLETHLGKTLGPGDDYAESWEVCDHGDDQSVVESGPLAGATLGELVSQHGADLLGRHAPQHRFPLLMKFLDARRTLSVQVHPNDAQAAQLDPPDLGKTEAWLVLDAEPGSLIYAGLKPGVDRQALAEAIEQGRCQDCLHVIEPAAGDCVFLPAGTVHALGEGLLVAEIQQSSDTTYRLFDWNRPGADGKPRPLHVEAGLAATDFDRGPVVLQQPQPTDRSEAVRLVVCDKFVLERWQVTAPTTIGGDQRCYIVSVLQGVITVEGDGPLVRGNTVLLPAATGEVAVEPQGKAVLMVTCLP